MASLTEKEYHANQRIETLLNIDPEWALKIIEFTDKNPEFKPYMYMCPMTRTPIMTSTSPTNVFDEILYCMASSGVRADYGFQMSMKLREHFKHNFPLLEYSFKVTDAKQKYYRSLIQHMLTHNLTPETLTYEKFCSCNFKNVCGIGPTTISMIDSKYGNVETVFPYTDSFILDGIKKVYGVLDKKQLHSLIFKWTGFFTVATGFLSAIHHYT
jgi:hypothetical protein